MMKSVKCKAQSIKLKRRVQGVLRKFWVLSFSFALYVLSFALGNASAQTVSSSELIENAKAYDGKTVSYQGEVIGDVMCRRDYCWVNLNDGQNALGIWLPKELTYIITYRGSYKSKGDWLEVSGIFNRACSQHGGDLDIHAISARKIKEGKYTPQQLNTKKRNFSLMLLGVLCLILILKRLKTS